MADGIDVRPVNTDRDHIGLLAACKKTGIYPANLIVGEDGMRAIYMNNMAIVY